MPHPLPRVIPDWSTTLIGATQRDNTPQKSDLINIIKLYCSEYAMLDRDALESDMILVMMTPLLLLLLLLLLLRLIIIIIIIITIKTLILRLIIITITMIILLKQQRGLLHLVGLRRHLIVGADHLAPTLSLSLFL